MSFKNKVVVITGGSAGIGATTAVRFAKEGANIAIVGRNEARLREVCQKCEKFGVKTLAIKADMSKDEEVKTIVQKVIEKFGKLDVLVNNAAIYKNATLASPDLLQIYDQVLTVNLRAVIHLTSLAAPHLVSTKGNIINISSVLGKTCLQNPLFMVYGASKAALDLFTKSAALELGASGVRVNTVVPGPVSTEMLASIDKEKTEDDYKSITLLDRVSDPEEIADVIKFLASDQAKGITGGYYTVDNGILVKF
ncbi:uncharacterized protein LOC113502777 [Trichoplusia ni]|uniref:Uncharacterized protein LOC113502777 n=1 Tax=Trichoplusia ni TaxID=7111 RepID=A0A7E5WHV0_TRINI|nr:uncharacterized protein LOC113502777 [Trichoplusia ni]